MMAQNDLVVVGIDVAKDKVDACIRRFTLRQTFPNTAQGHRKLVAWLRKYQVGKAVMEASGGYEREWRNVLHNAGIEVRIVDPRRVRSFAQSAFPNKRLGVFPGRFHFSLPNGQKKAAKRKAAARDESPALPQNCSPYVPVGNYSISSSFRTIVFLTKPRGYLQRTRQRLRVASTRGASPPPALIRRQTTGGSKRITTSSLPT